MTTTDFTPSTYRLTLFEALQRDLNQCKRFIALCREKINTAHNGEEVQVWAKQQDETLQEIEAIREQMKMF